MASTLRKVISAPHPDIELGYQRKEMEYYVTIPDKGIDKETGLIMSVCGFGESAHSDYQMKALRPYLADKYNCVVVGVNYFYIRRSGTFNWNMDFLKNFIYKYNVPQELFIIDGKVKFTNLEDVFAKMFEILHQKGINSLDLSCRPGFTPDEDYDSFGLLPALDNLTVLGKVLEEYPINCRKIIAFGSSYGGYVANLMAKYAPHTFSVVVDNSGFSRANPRELVEHELTSEGHGLRTFQVGDKQYTLFIGLYHPWTIVNETSPNYFSDSHRMIRSLLVEKHRVTSETRYYTFHSPEDTVAPISEKDMMVEILSKYNQVCYKRLTQDDIDGQVFKNMSHAMNASLRGLFDMVADLESDQLLKTTADTDYSMKSSRIFDCGNAKYIFTFSENEGLGVSIER